MYSDVIGRSGFVSWRPEYGLAEIGYALGSPYWGRGLATEAVRALLRFGFDVMKLNRLEARCNADNTGSERVMQKAGMTF
ncbi:GNAT family N-acetyltransferase [Paenibacillus sp. JX-17]|uniref:GNAT family N-acetyltransferase n=1 Tax=Paenibacillus lacisoli TaxID=3064525 RepID=A0ABT9CIF2_9BACL|nr:GNAT family N-acetyltransferase [Paenibacillus sp. JX-17]MDO7907451.1 GNAT family N-acetyltransferase [Paenibacillus sp. JX-17]